MASKWDAEAERKLLLFAIKECDAKPEKAAFEKATVAVGGDFTASACYQRFYKLKKEADAIIAKSGNGDGKVDAQPSTPGITKKTSAKPKASAKSAAKSTGRGRKRKTSEDENTVDETSDIDESPSKKAKEEPKDVEVESS